jgi:hypothetical protein
MYPEAMLRSVVTKEYIQETKKAYMLKFQC